MAFLDVCVAWLAALLNMNENGKYQTCIPSTGNMFALTGETLQPPICNNNLVIRRNVPTGYFFHLNGSEFDKNITWKGSHEYIFHPDLKKPKLVSILKMDAFSHHPFPVFVCHEYFQHESAESLGHGNFRHNIYLFPDDIPIHVSVIHSFNWNLQIARTGEYNKARQIELTA